MSNLRRRFRRAIGGATTLSIVAVAAFAEPSAASTASTQPVFAVAAVLSGSPDDSYVNESIADALEALRARRSGGRAHLRLLHLVARPSRCRRPDHATRQRALGCRARRWAVRGRRARRRGGPPATGVRLPPAGRTRDRTRAAGERLGHHPGRRRGRDGARRDRRRARPGQSPGLVERGRERHAAWSTVQRRVRRGRSGAGHRRRRRAARRSQRGRRLGGEPAAVGRRRGLHRGERRPAPRQRNRPVRCDRPRRGHQRVSLGFPARRDHSRRRRRRSRRRRPPPRPRQRRPRDPHRRRLRGPSDRGRGSRRRDRRDRPAHDDSADDCARAGRPAAHRVGQPAQPNAAGEWWRNLGTGDAGTDHRPGNRAGHPRSHTGADQPAAALGRRVRGHGRRHGEPVARRPKASPRCRPPGSVRARGPSSWRRTRR